MTRSKIYFTFCLSDFVFALIINNIVKVYIWPTQQMVEESKGGLGAAPKEDRKEGDVKMIDTSKPSDALDARR